MFIYCVHIKINSKHSIDTYAFYIYLEVKDYKTKEFLSINNKPTENTIGQNDLYRRRVAIIGLIMYYGLNGPKDVINEVFHSIRMQKYTIYLKRNILRVLP